MIPRHERRRLATRFVRVAAVDWPQLTVGAKRQVRVEVPKAPRFEPDELPSPIVAYVNDATLPDGYRHAGLFVCTACRTEALLAISAEDLVAEGFVSLAEFRRYWNAHRGAFKPLAQVAVLDIRPWKGVDDEVECGLAILGHLYGPWLHGSSA